MDIEFSDENMHNSFQNVDMNKEKIMATHETTDRGIEEINKEYFAISGDIRKLDFDLKDLKIFFKDIKEIAVFSMSLPFGILIATTIFLAFFKSIFDFSTIAILLFLSLWSGSSFSFISTIFCCNFLSEKTEKFLIKHSFQIKTIYNKIIEIQDEIEKKRDELIRLDIEKETLNNSASNNNKRFIERKNEIDKFNKAFIKNLKLCNHIDYEDITKSKKIKRLKH